MWSQDIFDAWSKKIMTKGYKLEFWSLPPLYFMLSNLPGSRQWLLCSSVALLSVGHSLCPWEGKVLQSLFKPIQSLLPKNLWSFWPLGHIGYLLTYPHCPWFYLRVLPRWQCVSSLSFTLRTFLGLKSYLVNNVGLWLGLIVCWHFVNDLQYFSLVQRNYTQTACCRFY